MAGVAHTPHLEKAPSGFFFRRRLPTAWTVQSNPAKNFALCLSLRTDVLSEAEYLVARMTALTDLASALTTESPVNHLKPEHVALLTELARCQTAAHEALRATAAPRSEAAANFAAQTERATQDMLRRANAPGERTPAKEPLRERAKRLGVAIDEACANWRTLAFWALRVMRDVSREREQREVARYEKVTPVFRSALANQPAAAAGALPAVTAQPAAFAPAIPAAAAQATISPPMTTMPADTVPAETDLSTPLQAPVMTAAAPAANTGAAPESGETPSPASECAPWDVFSRDDDTAFRIKLRPPLLENIDLRDLSPETQEVLKSKPRGITLLDGLCCTNRVMAVVPLSPDGLIPQPP